MLLNEISQYKLNLKFSLASWYAIPFQGMKDCGFIEARSLGKAGENGSD